MECKIQCPYCREKFSIQVFREEGEDQEFIWDCEICCRPIDIQAHWDADHERFRLRVGQGGDFDEMRIDPIF
ncbi:MAG: hypothetical protein OM95_11620 [Bdellovibrio sp. ArHS]|uniref:CPXCG motif-containing cysteine-rich protein n=1 Tax=Bdellovibrio sp. ArHS TaxID=1569284 RepID=UPI0005833624|nr:CPXCG motif-containing cysteine-rich protein [Bdellovibrio sp. ArHS]KHD87915.1 MAG: hypothetical protein OM95_11620 [Bdellovibrio sp. ArHS]